jgi:hypothetical protein
MSGTAADVIRIAKSQVGYHEGYSGGHWNNHQKFSPAVPGLEWSQNQAWCMTFECWCFQEAGVPKGSYPVTASCALGVSWWKQQNRFSEYPAIGAAVFFGPGGGSHTGLVYAYDTDYIYTVEGNTNSSGSAEGDGVYLKKRARRDTYVYGYGYPAYPGGIVTADPAWKNPTPSAKPTEEDPMAAFTKQDIYDAVWKTDAMPAPSTSTTIKTNPTWAPASVLGDVVNRVRAIETAEKAQTAAITALAKLVGSGVDTDAVIAAVQKAIADAVINVDVNVNTKES